ncbi:hypothetical protein Dip510_001922 [Elusimicrobium posterum]|uniref:hypothetical protein n=1 Tax=Elusimicrobium posterum TaxID=3116653 RepID=UPI003C7890C5
MGSKTLTAKAYKARDKKEAAQAKADAKKQGAQQKATQTKASAQQKVSAANTAVTNTASSAKTAAAPSYSSTQSRTISSHSSSVPAYTPASQRAVKYDNVDTSNIQHMSGVVVEKHDSVNTKTKKKK